MSRRERIVSARRDDLMAFPAVDKTEPQRIFELLGRKGEVTPERFALRNAYVVALNAYRGKAWEKACTGFEACLAIYLSKLFLERIAHLRVTALMRIGGASGPWRRSKLHGGAVSLFRNRKQFR